MAGIPVPLNDPISGWLGNTLQAWYASVNIASCEAVNERRSGGNAYLLRIITVLDVLHAMPLAEFYRFHRSSLWHASRHKGQWIPGSWSKIT